MSPELARALAELRQREEELRQLNRELEDTNRGVLALYAELDEKAEALRRADETKTRFLSSMSHELRTPLNSILAVSRLLLDRTDGELTPEQERQVGFVRESARGLAELVDDLLDLAKVEAGRVDVRPAPFAVVDLLGALRGMFRPLLTNDAVALVFEAPAGLPPLVTDEGKVGQILRNLISNALKFTERGEVRVAVAAEGGGRVAFAVADTGIGIAPADQSRLFQEFGQLESRLHVKAKGTGLGLALSKRLAELLGGDLGLVSAPGAGSTFTLRIPRVHPSVAAAAPALSAAVPGPATPAAGREGGGGGGTALVIDDEEAARYVLRALLAEVPFEVVEAADGAAGLERARRERPAAIFLDLLMPGLSGFDVLDALAADPATRGIPVVVTTSKALSEAERARLAADAVPVLSKELWQGAGAVTAIREALARAGRTRAGTAIRER